MKKPVNPDKLPTITRQDFLSCSLYQLQETFVVTYNRKPSLVLMPLETYEELLSHILKEK